MFGGGAVNQDVIEEDENKISKFISKFIVKEIVHRGLKSRWRIGEVERHDEKLVMSFYYWKEVLSDGATRIR